MTLDEHGRRLAHNEALFRDVNERIRELNEAFSTFSGVMEIVCECGDLGCIDLITIERADYERVRAESTWFVVIPGHEIVAIESVISGLPTHNVVEKRLGPAEEAAALDPRR